MMEACSIILLWSVGLIDNMELNEIKLSVDNAVEVNGDNWRGEFTVGDITYTYIFQRDIDPHMREHTNVTFFENSNNNIEEPTSKMSLPTGNARENYIKILSTMYSVINKHLTDNRPAQLFLTSNNKSGYYKIYNNLVDGNMVDGYHRTQDVELSDLYTGTKGEKATAIVLLRNDIRDTINRINDIMK